MGKKFSVKSIGKWLSENIIIFQNLTLDIKRNRQSQLVSLRL